MIASIRDKEAWILEKEGEIAKLAYMRPFVDLPEEAQAHVRRVAEFEYTDTMADYAESRGEGR